MRLAVLVAVYCVVLAVFVGGVVLGQVTARADCRALGSSVAPPLPAGFVPLRVEVLNVSGAVRP